MPFDHLLSRSRFARSLLFPSMSLLCALHKFLFGLLLVTLLVPLLVSASHSVQAQHHLKRDHNSQNAKGPPVEFAAPLDAPPVLVKSLYNQFAPHGKHAKLANARDKGIKRLQRWMHRLGLHPSDHQARSLYGMIRNAQREKHHDHGPHGEKHHEHKHKQRSKQHRVDKQHHHSHHEEKHDEHKQEHGEQHARQPAWVEVGDSKTDRPATRARPLDAGVLPPSSPHSWDDESNSWRKTTSSPAAAAIAPLPEPANIAAPTSYDQSGRTSRSDRPPAAGSLLTHSEDARAPVTSAPSASIGTSESARTSGSLNPSSTPASTWAQSNPSKTADPRLDPLAANSTRHIAGIPIADDGDMKVGVASAVNRTDPTLVGGAKSSGSIRTARVYRDMLGSVGLQSVVLGAALAVIVILAV